MWWDDTRIEETVTRQFVGSKLAPQDVQRLDQPLGFGDGLTDNTYWDLIHGKAKRIFLILLDLGVPDQIFTVVDDSWDDDDLPIGEDQVNRLTPGARRDDKLSRKFFARQFHYIVKFLSQGDHIDYDESAVIPVNVLEKRSNIVDKVEVANRSGEPLLRRRIPLDDGPGSVSEEDFLCEVDKIRGPQIDHLMSYYASYTHQGYGYIIWTPASEYSLKSILTTPPSNLKSLDKQTRRIMTMNWIHCLVDSLCYLHNTGRSHGNIKPSTIFFTSNNDIMYASTSALSAEILATASEKQAFNKESYDYAAPELWYKPPVRKNTLTSPTSPQAERSAFVISRGAGVALNPDKVNNGQFSSSAPLVPQQQQPPSPTTATATTTPQLNPQAADIFSLGCVILDMLSTFLLKRQQKAFSAHRSAKHKMAGRGGAVPDSSFHKNLGQVETWMAGLARDAKKKEVKGKGSSGGEMDKEGKQVFSGVGDMLRLVARMLSVSPSERPGAGEVEGEMYGILTGSCGIGEPHCVHRYQDQDYQGDQFFNRPYDIGGGGGGGEVRGGGRKEKEQQVGWPLVTEMVEGLGIDGDDGEEDEDEDEYYDGVGIGIGIGRRMNSTASSSRRSRGRGGGGGGGGGSSSILSSSGGSSGETPGRYDYHHHHHYYNRQQNNNNNNNYNNARSSSGSASSTASQVLGGNSGIEGVNKLKVWQPPVPRLGAGGGGSVQHHHHHHHHHHPQSATQNQQYQFHRQQHYAGVT